MDELFKTLSLKTKRLHIALFKDEDLAAVYEMHSQDQVNEFIPYNTWRNWQDAQVWLEMIHQRRADKEAQLFVLKNHDDNSLVGTSLVFGATEGSRAMNIGYVVNPNYWGKGYATEAMQALVNALFKNDKVEQLNATVVEGNVGSMKVLVKVGFTALGRDVEEDGTQIHRFSCFETSFVE